MEEHKNRGTHTAVDTKTDGPIGGRSQHNSGFEQLRQGNCKSGVTALVRANRNLAVSARRFSLQAIDQNNCNFNPKTKVPACKTRVNWATQSARAI